MHQSLDQIPLLEKWKIIDVKGDDPLRRRLLDLGFIPGADVLMVLISPFKNPKAYQINGNILALRNQDAKKIYVERELI